VCTFGHACAAHPTVKARSRLRSAASVPWLRRPQVRWAAENGIGLTTADTPAELAKLARWHPRTAVLLRIRADDPSARCCLARRAAHAPCRAGRPCCCLTPRGRAPPPRPWRTWGPLGQPACLARQPPAHDQSDRLPGHCGARSARSGQPCACGVRRRAGATGGRALSRRPGEQVRRGAGRRARPAGRRTPPGPGRRRRLLPRRQRRDQPAGAARRRPARQATPGGQRKPDGHALGPVVCGATNPQAPRAGPRACGWWSPGG